MIPETFVQIYPECPAHPYYVDTSVLRQRKKRARPLFVKLLLRNYAAVLPSRRFCKPLNRRWLVLPTRKDLEYPLTKTEKQDRFQFDEKAGAVAFFSISFFPSPANH